MGRQVINMLDGTVLVVGYDPPFKTWFAQHYDDGDVDAAPRVAIGYHPDEQALARAERPDIILGPYPVETCEELLRLVPELTGIEPIAEEDQAMCVYCGEPPWQPGMKDCPDHPHDRLMHG